MWENTSKTTWYSLLVVENSKIEKYGFTAAKGQKRQLLLALEAIENKEEAMLLGIWTGNYSTNLFVLDIDIAIKKLSMLS